MTFWGWLSDLLERLSDLQLGDQKVTLNHLVDRFLLQPLPLDHLVVSAIRECKKDAVFQTFLRGDGT